MTEKQGTSAEPEPTFVEIELAGPEERGHGFLAGWLMGAGRQGQVFHAGDLGGGRASLRHLLRDVVSAGGGCHAVVDSQTLELLRRDAARIEAEAGLALRERGVVRSARFTFKYQAYTHLHAEEIHQLLASLPEGVELTHERESETVDRKAEGVELYAPAHDYELKGHGTLSGRVDRVVAAHHLMDAHPLLEPGAIELTRA